MREREPIEKLMIEALWQVAADSVVTLQPCEGEYAAVPDACGVLLRFRNRIFVGTVNHVFDDFETAGVGLDQLTIMFAPIAGVTGSLETVEQVQGNLKDPPPKLMPATPVRFEVKNLMRTHDRVRDLALFEIDPAILPPHARPYELPHRSPGARSKEPILALGFPQAASLPVKHPDGSLILRSAYASLLIPVRKEENPKRWRDEDFNVVFNPRHNFAMKFDPYQAGFGRKGVVGMSGCPIWRVRHKAKIWSPKLTLVGIQTSQMTGMKRLRATRVRVMKGLLSRIIRK